jgi:hypothetical protein
VIGPVVVIIAIVVAIPVSILVTGAVASALFGHLLQKDVEEVYAGSELIELNR